MISYSEFMALTIARVRERKERLGEAAFNVIAERYPHIAYKIRGTEYDPTNTLKIRKMAHYLEMPNIPPANLSATGLLNKPKTIDLTDTILDIRDSSMKSGEFRLIELEF